MTEKRVRIVELAIQGGLFNKFNSSFVAKNHFTIQFHENSSLEERAQLLAAELTSRYIPTRHAASTIQSLGVRTVSAEIPHSITNIDEWIRDNYEKLIRIPVPLHDILFSYEILSENGSSLITEITFVRKSEIEQIQRFISLSGLILHSLSAGTRDALNTLLYSASFLLKESVLFYYYIDSAVICTEFEKKKRVRSYSIDNSSTESTPTHIDILKAGEVSDNKESHQIFSLPTEYTLAAGCALKAFIPELHTLNLLPVTVDQNNRQTISKNLFHRTVFACGGLLLALLLAQTLFSIYIASVDEGLDNQLIESGLNYSELLQIEKQNEELRLELQKTGSMEFRSNNAALLHDIAANVPNDLWLYKIDIDASKGKAIIAGYTSNGDRIAEFLKKCEKEAFFRGIRLTRSGLPLQSEDMTLVAKRISSPVTFQVQALLRGK